MSRNSTSSVYVLAALLRFSMSPRRVALSEYLVNSDISTLTGISSESFMYFVTESIQVSFGPTGTGAGAGAAAGLAPGLAMGFGAAAAAAAAAASDAALACSWSTL